MYHKQILLGTFAPLSESGRRFLEVTLINPKTAAVEGRGFFNDPDFLLEASGPHLGRFNFGLTPFAYAQDQLPTRGSFNQFDRSLADNPLQDSAARAHSLTATVFFKPELIKELSAQGPSPDAWMGIVYQLDHVLTRMGMKSFGMDYFLSGMTIRFQLGALGHKYAFHRPALAALTKRLIEAMGKEMTPAESKKFALASPFQDKVHDPLPGLPGFFTSGEAAHLVHSTGTLRPLDEQRIQDWAQELFEGKKAQAMPDAYAAVNLQGLSQTWTEEDLPEISTRPGPAYQEPPRAQAFHSPAGQAAANAEVPGDLADQLRLVAANRWRWSLPSQAFQREHGGIGCGQMLLLQTAPFGAELGFHFLVQGAEALARQGQGQVVVFSKKRNRADLALAGLARHLQAHPLEPGQIERFRDAKALAEAWQSLFPPGRAPQAPPCAPQERMEQLNLYLDHDYLLQAKKRGGQLPPLCIILDNPEEFAAEGPELYRELAQLKLKLRELNATLWALDHARAPGETRPIQALADHLAVLEFDGGAASPGRDAQPARAWEDSFPRDPGAARGKDSWVRIRFRAHGSHAGLASAYAFRRSGLIFQEVQEIASPEVAPALPEAHASAAPARPARAAHPHAPAHPAPAKPAAPARPAPP